MIQISSIQWGQWDLNPACKGVQWFALLILQPITFKDKHSSYFWISEYCEL